MIPRWEARQGVAPCTQASQVCNSKALSVPVCSFGLHCPCGLGSEEAAELGSRPRVFLPTFHRCDSSLCVVALTQFL